MTHQSPTQIYSASSPPPRFPSGPNVMDTQRLWQALPGLYAVLMSFVTETRIRRGARAHIWAMHRLLHIIYRAEVANFRLWLVQSLRLDPAWQAQVLADLGGHRALSRWEQRRERLKHRTCLQARTPRRTPKPRKSAPIKTDRHGLFRLARLSAPGQERTRRVSLPTPRYRMPCSAFLRPSPTPLTPRDLRPRRHIRPGNLPTPNRHTLMRVWWGLQCHLQDWNMRIAFADMEMSLIGGRAKPPP